MDDAFAAGGTPKEQEIWRNIAEWNREAVTKAEQGLIRRVLLLLPSKRHQAQRTSRNASLMHTCEDWCGANRV